MLHYFMHKRICTKKNHSLFWIAQRRKSLSRKYYRIEEQSEGKNILHDCIYEGFIWILGHGKKFRENIFDFRVCWRFRRSEWSFDTTSWVLFFRPSINLRIKTSICVELRGKKEKNLENKCQRNRKREPKAHYKIFKQQMFYVLCTAK